MKMLKIAVLAAIVATTVGIGANTASATGNTRPICFSTSFNMPAPGQSVEIRPLDRAFDRDGDPLEIIDVFGTRDGVAVIDDNGTTNDTTDDVIVYTRTAPLLWGWWARSESFLFSVSDGSLHSQCWATFFPSNPW